ncbi:hypothetical protein ACTV2D_000107 [Cronobacter dublinensis]
MTSMATMLKPISVKLEDILLDPNNPRFSDLGEDVNPIQEGRFADEKVQAYTFDRMKADSFDVAELRDTIKTLGFLPMDKIVLRKWKGSSNNIQKFIVVEGNRRVTALKWLLHLHNIGKESFSPEQIENFTILDCLLIDESLADDSVYLILPGLRHVSGIKEWGPYQKAKAVYTLRTSGMSAQQAAQSLGLSTRAANSAYRCYLALEGMKQDEEFGEYAQPKMYSFFEEIFKKANLKSWLEWNDEKGKFLNEERLGEFYGWIVNIDGEDEAKITSAIQVRELAAIIADDSALNILRAPDGTLSRAIARYEIEHPQEWLPKINSAFVALRSLTPELIRAMTENELKTLVDLQSLISSRLNDRELLLSGTKDA